MIYLITGASHTGKTMLAQRILEEKKIPYLSIDHLKMGLIRSGLTSLTPESEEDLLTELLWPILREMIRTALENDQNLTVEGCYIPFDWQKDFSAEERIKIHFQCLVMSEHYINEHFNDIKKYASVIENRNGDDGCTKEWILSENRKVRKHCIESNMDYTLIDEGYNDALLSVQ